jgi:hypothetical protein
MVELWLTPDGSAGVDGIQLGFAVSGAVETLSVDLTTGLGAAFDPLDASFASLSELLGGSDPGTALAFVLLAATPLGSPIEDDTAVRVATLNVGVATSGAGGTAGRVELMSVEGWLGPPVIAAGPGSIASNVGCTLGDVPGLGSDLCIAPLPGNPAFELELIPEPGLASLLMLAVFSALVWRTAGDW